MKALDASTWDAWSALVEANGGVWGGCWCVGFHHKIPKDATYEGNREIKRRRVADGTTHSALVFDGDECVGWCQYGPTAELPVIKSLREYEKGVVSLPDWRVTCFFTGKGHRKQGVASAALGGAVSLIADAGGGVVESYPEDTTDRKISGSFLHNGSLALFEAHGFERVRRIAKHRWVVAKTIYPSDTAVPT